MTQAVSLVTGAAGFIGAHLVRRLLDRGDRVHVLVRPTSSLSRIADLTDRLTVHRVQFADRANLRAVVRLAAPDRVFHLAAETRRSPAPDIAAARGAASCWVEPALNLVEALTALARPPRVLVRTGTIAEYGNAALPFAEDGRARPTTPYGAGMLAATEMLAMLAPTLPFPVVTARLALCYGPGQSPHFMVPGLIDACLSRRPITLQRPADRRDLLHVDEVVDALLRIAAPPHGEPGGGCDVVNISSGTSIAVSDVAARIVAMTGGDPSLVTHGRPGDPPVELRCCARLARARLGWESHMNLDEGLARTIEAEKLIRTKAG